MAGLARESGSRVSGAEEPNIPFLQNPTRSGAKPTCSRYTRVMSIPLLSLLKIRLPPILQNARQSVITNGALTLSVAAWRNAYLTVLVAPSVYTAGVPKDDPWDKT